MNVAVKQIVDTQLGAELTEKEAWKLAGLMTIRELGSGDYLIEEGAADDSLHVMVEGNLPDDHDKYRSLSQHRRVNFATKGTERNIHLSMGPPRFCRHVHSERSRDDAIPTSRFRRAMPINRRFRGSRGTFRKSYSSS